MTARLLEALDGACRLWPHERATFAHEHASRVAAGTIHVDDLYLASACAAGVPAAVHTFDQDFLGQLDRLLAPLTLTPSLLDDIRAMLREQLLVGGEQKRPLIAQYSGKGRLLAWLRVVATRMALRELQRGKRLVATDAENLMAIPDAGDDPEVLYAKSAHREDFEVAFRDALEELSPRERNVLRYRYLDGVSLERLAALYRVDRATAVRWLAAARKSVLARTRRALMKRIGAPREQVSSLMRGMLSQLDVSLQRLLRSTTVVVLLAIALTGCAQLIGVPDPLTWDNQPIAPHTATMSWQFDAVPASNGIDAVIGLSHGNAFEYGEMATAVRFNSSGVIDIRNGDTYDAATTLAYRAGTSYHVSATVDVAAKLYDVRVAPAGGAEQLLATQYSFRTEQNDVTVLDNVVIAEGDPPGMVDVSNLAVSP